MAHTGRHDRPEHPEQEGEEIDFTKKDRAGVRETKLEESLNINSIMDIMTILLTFLLVSITSDPWNVKQTQYMQLAPSTVDRKPEDSLAILVTRRSIVVDDQEVVPVECVTGGGRQCRTDEDYAKPANRYFVDKSYKEDGAESSFLLVNLLKRLTDKMEFAKEVHAATKPNEAFKAMTTIIADREIPYRMIAEIVHTAGNAGIDQLRFAVMRNSER